MNAERFVRTLREQNGNMQLYRNRDDVLVTEDVEIDGEWDQPINLNRCTFMGNFNCGNALFKEKVNFNGRFQRIFSCGNATFQEECLCGEGTFLGDYDCGSAQFLKELNLAGCRLENFFCGSAVFRGKINLTRCMFSGDFICGSATFENGLMLGIQEEEKTEFLKSFHALHHKDLAEKILYYKQGIII